MITRNEILSKAVDDCFKEIYSFVTPKVDWDDFVEQNNIYNKAYKEWENYQKDKSIQKEYNEKLGWEGKSMRTCIGPRPYEFYYLSADILKDIVDSYVSAYKIDEHKELTNTIAILKDYCKNPIVDKYIDSYIDENGNHHPGYRSYDHPDNLEKEICEILGDIAVDNNYYQDAICNKFFEFLDMAENFYNWNGELSSFNMSIYLGASPNSNKEAVIENWKQYRGKDIEINEKQIKKDYYGEDELD